MSSDQDTNNNSNSNSEPNKETPEKQDNTYYQRKKNWISGVDNDLVVGAIATTALGVGIFAALPTLKDIWNNYVTRMQTAPPPPPPPLPQQQIEEPYIPPTPPENNNIPPAPVQTEQQEQEQPPQEEKEDVEVNVFYDEELKNRHKMLGKRPPSKYESPFGKDIGGL